MDPVIVETTQTTAAAPANTATPADAPAPMKAAPAKKATPAKAPAAAKPAAKKAVVTPARPAEKSTEKPAAKPVAKQPAKPAAKPVAKPVEKAAKPVKAEKAEKAAKPSKSVKPAKADKLVRDSFTIPRAEYTLLQELKSRSATLGKPAKKSEVLRAGIQALKALDDKALLAMLAQVPVIKTGRPSHD